MNQELIQIADKDIWKKIQSLHLDKGGVYKIIAMHENKRMPINRFLGTDDSGVLYIGKAISFIERVIDLKKSILPQYNGTKHICGRRYKSITSIADKFRSDKLYMELISSEEPEILERKLLDDYRNLYGEVPPLNAI
jgi:hypothetical protein